MIVQFRAGYVEGFYEKYIEDVLMIAEVVQTYSFNFNTELKEIQDMKFHLEEMPEEAIADFNILYAQVQSYQSRVTSLIIELYKERAKWQAQKRQLARIYKKMHNFILSTDEKIQKLRNKELQEASVDLQLKEVVDLKDYIDGVLEDISWIRDSLVEKKDELDKANVNLSRQQRIIESMIGLGYPVGIKREN